MSDNDESPGPDQTRPRSRRSAAAARTSAAAVTSRTAGWIVAAALAGSLVTLLLDRGTSQPATQQVAIRNTGNSAPAPRGKTSWRVVAPSGPAKQVPARPGNPQAPWRVYVAPGNPQGPGQVYAGPGSPPGQGWFYIGRGNPQGAGQVYAGPGNPSGQGWAYVGAGNPPGQGWTYVGPGSPPGQGWVYFGPGNPPGMRRVYLGPGNPPAVSWTPAPSLRRWTVAPGCVISRAAMPPFPPRRLHGMRVTRHWRVAIGRAVIGRVVIGRVAIGRPGRPARIDIGQRHACSVTRLPQQAKVHDHG